MLKKGWGILWYCYGITFSTGTTFSAVYFYVLQLILGTVDTDGNHTPGLLALAYQRLAENQGLAASQVHVKFAVGSLA